MKPSSLPKPPTGSLRVGPALLGTLLVAGVTLPPLHAQDADVKMAPDFDPARAYMPDEPDFVPFLVEETLPLREALQEGRVDEETAVLLAEVAGRRIALVTDQMAYHHIAQGEMMGEPWMVSF